MRKKFLIILFIFGFCTTLKASNEIVLSNSSYFIQANSEGTDEEHLKEITELKRQIKAKEDENKKIHSELENTTKKLDELNASKIVFVLDSNNTDNSTNHKLQLLKLEKENQKLKNKLLAAGDQLKKIKNDHKEEQDQADNLQKECRTLLQKVLSELFTTKDELQVLTDRNNEQEKSLLNLSTLNDDYEQQLKNYAKIYAESEENKIKLLNLLPQNNELSSKLNSSQINSKICQQQLNSITVQSNNYQQQINNLRGQYEKLKNCIIYPGGGKISKS